MKNEIKTTKGSIAIREGRATDVLDFKKLRLSALKENPTAFGADYEETSIRPLSYWKNRLKPDEQSILVFAESEKSLIGMTGIYRGNTKQTRHNATIWGVFVTQNWRGYKVASAMIDYCCEWAKLRGVKVVKLGVMANNTPAIRSYEQSGFTIYAKEPYAIFYDGEYYEGAFMFRIISEI